MGEKGGAVILDFIVLSCPDFQNENIGVTVLKTTLLNEIEKESKGARC